VKLLLDENLPHLLRNNLGDHDVFTVRSKGWAGLKNGELLKTADEEGFERHLGHMEQPTPTQKKTRKRRHPNREPDKGETK
jgi:hypothetical protein